MVSHFDHEGQGPGQVAGRVGEAAAVTGDEVRDTRFVTKDRGIEGYDAAEVDDLLRRVATELDAGGPAGPLIEDAAFQRKVRSRRYDIEAVDWFLGQFLLRPVDAELAGASADPWCDLPVAQFARSGGSGAAGRAREWRRYFSGECAKVWANFGQQPGMALRWGRAGGVRLWPVRYELRTVEQQTIASREGFARPAVHVGGRGYTFTRADAAMPGGAERVARIVGDYEGHYAKSAPGGMSNFLFGTPPGPNQHIEDLVDETGTPVLYIGGANYHGRAYAAVTFPDQRWLRFLVRGTDPGIAIMTAVDQAGNRVARYRKGERRSVEITVHPDQMLTDELVLTIAISADWLRSYFHHPDPG